MNDHSSNRLDARPRNEVGILRERLARIERTLGVLVMDGMPVATEIAILTAWWESRVDVPDDDPVRVSMLAEREEYGRQMGVLDVA